MSLSENMAGGEETPPELIIPDYTTPGATDTGGTIGSSAPAAVAPASIGGVEGALEGCCSIDPLPPLLTVPADSNLTDHALAEESARRQTALYNISAYRESSVQ